MLYFSFYHEMRSVCTSFFRRKNCVSSSCPQMVALAKKHLLFLCKICVYITIFAKFHCVQKSLCVNIYTAAINVGTYYSAQSIIDTVTPLFAVSDFWDCVCVCARERMWVCIRSCVESCKWLNAWKQHDLTLRQFPLYKNIS